MTDDRTPTDIAVGLAAKYEATEGAPVPPDVLLDSFVKMAEWTVENSPDDDDTIDAVKRLALGAAPLDPDAKGCDACDGTYSLAVVEAADAILDGWATAYDSNGDPDVATCPFCNREARDWHPPIDEEFEVKVRHAVEDEALVAGDTPADRDAIIRGLGWSA